MRSVRITGSPHLAGPIDVYRVTLHIPSQGSRDFIAAEQQIAFSNTLRAGDSLHLGIALVENYTFVTGHAELARIAQVLGMVTVYMA
ncbi:MAG: hypothetical protein O7G88_04595 [bacterium]|nr:hypothetical protein [bacterium]